MPSRTLHFVLPLGLTLAVAGALLGGRFDGAISGFFRVGGQAAVSPLLEEADLLRFSGSDGYDGQFFLTLGLDPLLLEPGSAAALDNPPYRQRRLLYPLLGHLLGLGRPALVPWALVLLNLLCAPLLVWLCARILARAPPGRRPLPRWAPLLALGLPGLWFSLVLSTADLLGSTLLLLCLERLQRRRFAGAALALGLACLTRETYLLLWPALFAVQLWRRGPGRLPLALAGLPAVAWNLWVLAHTAGGTSGVRENLGPPLCGIAGKLLSLARGGVPRGDDLLEPLLFPLLLATAALVGRDLWVALSSARRTPSGPPSAPDPALFSLSLAACAAVYLGLLLLSSEAILVYRGGYARVFLDLGLLLLLGLPGAPHPRLRLGLLCAGAAGAVWIAASYIVS